MSTTRAAAGVAGAATVLGEMPPILYGTAWKQERTADLVRTAFQQGFRGVDTAAQRKHYREDLVGLGVRDACRALHLSRHDVWIQTKYVRRLTADSLRPRGRTCTGPSRTTPTPTSPTRCAAASLPASIICTPMQRCQTCASCWRATPCAHAAPRRPTQPRPAPRRAISPTSRRHSKTCTLTATCCTRPCRRCRARCKRGPSWRPSSTRGSCATLASAVRPRAPTHADI